MTQIRYVGINDDVTQEMLLMVSRASAISRVISGMNATIQDTGTPGSLNINVAAGNLVMPDGMIIQETTDISVPLTIDTTMGPVAYQGTLVAEKGLGQGALEDVVIYNVILGLHFSDTLPQIPGRIRMPMALIVKNTGGITAANFLTKDLGSRSKAFFTDEFVPPLPIIDSTTGMNANVILQTPNLVHSLIPGTNQTYFLPVNSDADSFISNISFQGTCPSGNCALVITSLSYGSTYSNLVNVALSFGSTVAPVQSFYYPYGSKVFSDVLQIQVVNLNNIWAASNSFNPFYLSGVNVNRINLFSLV